MEKYLLAYKPCARCGVDVNCHKTKEKPICNRCLDYVGRPSHSQYELCTQCFNKWVCNKDGVCIDCKKEKKDE